MELALDLCLALHVGALMLWFGALSLSRVVGVALSAGELRVLQAAAALALASAVLWPGLQTAVLLESPRTAFDLVEVSRVLRLASFGHVWLARIGLVLFATVVGTLPLFMQARAVHFLVVAALGSVALVGHAAGVAGLQGGIERMLLALHLIAGGAWLGALPFLWLRVERLPAPEMTVLLRRFSRYGFVLVSAVLVSGAASAWFRCGGHLDALAQSSYGRILFVKIGLVGVMGMAAFNNRNRLMPALAQDDPYMQVHARRGLRWSIALETALGLAVLGAATVLGATETPQ